MLDTRESSLGTAESSLPAVSLERRSSPGTVRRLLRVPLAGPSLAVILVFATCAVFAPLLAPYSPRAQNANEALQGISASHPLGTDQLGRDVLSRLVYGARVSMGIAFGAVAFGAAIGIPLGLLAGFFRGILDEVIMRLMEVLLAFPGLIFALALVATLGPSVRNLVIAIGIGSVPGLARLVRSTTLSVRELDYVTAARAVGAGNMRILFKHVWPNCMASVIVATTLGMGFAVLAEAGLSFLGVGVRPPTASWGSMLTFAFQYLRLDPLLSIVPGMAIFLLVLAFNLVGDGLRDALDPRLKGVGR